MRLAIADPPYPPHVTRRFDVDGGRRVVRSRARRYYGDGTRSAGETPADFHPAAGDWDDPARHRRLLDDLAATYDGWAIATSADGVAAYGPLPEGCRLLAWVKPNNPPSGSRVLNAYESVIAWTPPTRRRDGKAGGVGGGCSTCSATDTDTDTVDDLFPGSGGVARAVDAYQAVLL